MKQNNFRKPFFVALLFVFIFFLLCNSVSVPAQDLLNVGDITVFGRYEQDNDPDNGPEPIEWQVLAVDPDAGRALVISRYGLDAKRYNEKYGSITWENCTLRTWLNGEFYSSAFSTEEQSRIRQVTNGNPKNPDYGTDGGNDTQDWIFLLSIDEARMYFASDEARQCYATDYAKANGVFAFDTYGTSYWWLRSPVNFYIGAAHVTDTGSVDTLGKIVFSSAAMVRPAFWLDL